VNWKHVMDHDHRISGVLRRAYDQNGWTPVEDRTPLDDLMDAEPEWDMDADAPGGAYAWPSEQQADIQLQALKREEAAAVAAWAREQLVRWIAGDGMHPFRIVQRFFALCFARYGDLCGPLNGTTLAEMMGQGRAAFSATMREIFGKPSETKLGVKIKVATQKSAAASAKYAASAKRVKPKQRLEVSELDDEAEQVMEQRDAAADQRKLQEARAAAEQRELEADAAAFERIIHSQRKRP